MADDKSEAPIGDLLGEELRKKLESEHGEIVAVQTKAGVAAFRVFKKAEYDRYNRLFFDEKTRSQSFEVIVKACCVHPDPPTFTAWVDKRPGIVTTCLNHVMDLGGVSTDAESKKYGSA